MDTVSFAKTPEQADLWGQESWILPKPLEDQSLYSWCSVFHRASGNIDAGTTSRQLFGHRDAAFIHDLPWRLNRFELATQCLLGKAEHVALTRTLAGFYAPFLPAEKFRRLLDSMNGNQLGAIKAELGLSRSGIVTSGVHKACVDCMEEERSRLGLTYWHFEHQWPSVAICEKHQTLLWRFETPGNSKRSRVFYQPLAISPTAWIRGRDISSRSRRLLLSLVAWSKHLAACPGLHLDEELLRWTYLLQAKQRSWTAFDGNLRLQRLKEAFHAEFQEISMLPGFAIAADTEGPNAGFLGGMFRQVVGQRHPVKHLLLLNFLFDGPEAFLKTYADHEAVRNEGGVAALIENLTEARFKLKGWIENQIMSVNKAAQTVGVPTTQAIKYLDKVGVRREKRPRIVGTETEERLRTLLSQGVERAAIAKELNIRRSFIKDYLATHADLEEIWSERDFLKRQERYREKFLGVLHDNPGLPVKRIRRIPGNGFQWLYKNDLDWLKSVLPAIWRRP